MTAPAPFDLVIFDLDGTLVDSAPDIAAALNHTLAGIGLPALELDVVTGYVGDGAAKLLERALAAAPPSPSPSGARRPTAALLQSFLDRYRDHLCDATRLYPGIPDLLASLRSIGTALAVLTNKPDALVMPLLEALSIADRFMAIVGDGAGYPRKPDPAAARALIARAGTVPARTAVVGDGVPDVRMASAVPCVSVAAEWGYVSKARLLAEGPTYLATSTADATRILCATEAAARAPASEH
jgi:phosphoglycolate phosphatase